MKKSNNVLPKIKIKAVQEYMNGEGSHRTIAKKY